MDTPNSSEVLCHVCVVQISKLDTLRTVGLPHCFTTVCRGSCPDPCLISGSLQGTARLMADWRLLMNAIGYMFVGDLRCKHPLGKHGWCMPD